MRQFTPAAGQVHRSRLLVGLGGGVPTGRSDGVSRTEPRQADTSSRGPLLVALMSALIVLAAVTSAAPWAAAEVGLELPVPTYLEVVDHVVPGVVIVAVAVAVLTGRLSPLATLVAALVAALAGLWMVATHVPLLAQARTPLVSWPTALAHSVPGLVTFALTIVAAMWAWRQQSAAEAAAASAKGRARG